MAKVYMIKFQIPLTVNCMLLVHRIMIIHGNHGVSFTLVIVLMASVGCRMGIVEQLQL